jgi:hypothetical protein
MRKFSVVLLFLMVWISYSMAVEVEGGIFNTANKDEADRWFFQRSN